MISLGSGPSSGEPGGEPGSGTRDAPWRPEMEPRPPRPHVLCVDDDPELLAGLRLVLRSRFQVTTATTGEAALRLLRTLPIDVILSDVAMPGMSGPSLLASARRLAPDATRVLLTGNARTVTDPAMAEEAQVFRVLEKPCLADDLVQALEEAAAHGQASRAPPEGRPADPSPGPLRCPRCGSEDLQPARVQSTLAAVALEVTALRVHRCAGCSHRWWSRQGSPAALRGTWRA